MYLGDMMKFNLLILSSLIFLTGCSLNKGLSAEEKNAAFQNYLTMNNLEDVEKVTTFKFRGWHSLTNEYLMLSSSHKRQYLIELSGFCSEISWAHALIINRSMGSSLHARFDSFSTPEEPRLKCMIKSIYPITEKQEDEIKKLAKPDEKNSEEFDESEKNQPDS
jgi:hypothetical protein